MTAHADLAEVRAALALVAKATPGPLTVGRFAHDNDLDSAAAIHVATGETIATFDNADRTDEASPVREAIAMIALHNAAPAIAAAVEELERLRAETARQRETIRAGADAVRSANASTTEIGCRLDDAGERIAALERQVCRLVSGQEIDGDRLCQHHGADVAALALLSDERAAHAETSRDLDALLTALGAQVTPGGQTLESCHARRVADGMRRARELVAARAVPADFEAAIASLVAAARDATNYEPDRTTAAKHLAAERIVKESVANLRTAIAAEIKRARAEGRGEATAAPATVARPISEWHEDIGAALWWRLPIEEPPYSGSPLDSDWPGYHTHWTPIVCPDDPQTEADADPASRGPIGASSPPNPHPDGCHTTDTTAPRDCASDGHHECSSCTRKIGGGS